MNPPQVSSLLLEDTQNQAAPWPIFIDAVGVCGLRLPVHVADRARGAQLVTATLSLSASLAHDAKGSHMSRFVEVLEEARSQVFTPLRLATVLDELRRRLQARQATLEMAFPFFLERRAPHTGAAALMDYSCTYAVTTDDTGPAGRRFVLTVEAPVAALCPCSKAISDYGAHNQRGRIRMEITPRRAMDGGWDMPAIEECITLAEGAASSPVYPLLKRPDERVVTMRMYENPVFVEDMARHTAAALMADERVQAFRVHAETLESIHNHNAFARIAWTRDS
ncbi:MAG: GTP cyclohydrolase FolE2 [Desulfovibrio sp.]|nr:GTP cyclohydrolase FolE2 [Desulfovibrio sp.]MCA1986618.1 GTP cyclohydrolase FolE2 [Desulfovibrio sp.]